MAYETKVILIALANIIRETGDVAKIYAAVAEMANAEGVVLPPYDERLTKTGECGVDK